jgi:Uma2 family endonuclease
MTVPMGIFSREAYRDWCAQQPRGRFERVEGRIVPMARERIGHVRMRAVYMRRCTAR